MSYFAVSVRITKSVIEQIIPSVVTSSLPRISIFMQKKIGVKRHSELDGRKAKEKPKLRWKF